MSNIANLLRTLRKQKNYSIRKLAIRSHVSRSYISAIELGQYQPSLVILKKLALALGESEQKLYHAAGYIDHPYMKVDVTGLPGDDIDLIDKKFDKLTNAAVDHKNNKKT